MKELTDIDLRYSRVTSNGIEALRAALPNAKVQFVGSSMIRPKTAGAARPAANTDQAIGAWVKAMGGTADFAGARLKAVDLSSTSISDAQLSFLSGLTGLEKLNLEVTQIGDLGLASLAGLTGLQRAESQQHDGFGHRSREAGRIDATSEPQACRNPGGGAGARFPEPRHRTCGSWTSPARAWMTKRLSHVGKMAALERLRLNYTDVADNGMKRSQARQSCRCWTSPGTDVADAGLAQIAALTNLRELYLNHARFTDKGLASLKPLQNLERIEMLRTRATNAGVESLAALKNLSAVKLDYTAIDDKAVESLKALPKMRELSLDSTGVTDSGAAGAEIDGRAEIAEPVPHAGNRKGNAGAEEPRCLRARSFSTAIRRCRIEGAHCDENLAYLSCCDVASAASAPAAEVIPAATRSGSSTPAAPSFGMRPAKSPASTCAPVG